MRNDEPRIAHYAALQAVTEIGVGSFVHGLRIPLGGHALSLNQGVILTFAVRQVGDVQTSLARGPGCIIVSGISLVAAALKILSPAGARIMPAIAISLQGFLFSAGLAFFGVNRIGVMLGGVLASLWAFLHPIIFGYLLFGHTLFDAVVKLWSDIAVKLGVPVELGLQVLFGVVALKGLVAAVLGFFSWSADVRAEHRYLARLSRLTASFRRDLPSSARALTPFQGMLRDLSRPIFLLSLVLSIGFVLWSGKGGVETLFYLARVVGVAGLLFYGIRAFPQKWAIRIATRFPVLAQTAEEIRRSRT